MEWLIPVSIIISTIIIMEVLSWAMHKYLFHGPLWFIHKTHHQQRHGFFELNDIFSFGFGALALWLLYSGHQNLNYKFWIGAGISIYGIIYFIFHDWFIHNRLKAFKSENKYLKGIRRAHKIHHKTTEKDGSEEFGLLVASKKYFK
ncbi:sterol desaturase family protein [Pedobacter alpinus]|uniref:Sterol desaturase family protein n=1 Tax=Pedobacter alpinus TaxID=1590643 RepID=A0ABW5TQA7_9SPHI